MEPRLVLQSGLRVGNYILREKVGQGAFAEVWQAAHHERPNRVVAVKLAVNPEFRRQLAREGGLPDLDHPNIVPILDSDTRFAEIPYIVMPYLPGGNLADLIAKHPDGLPEERVEALLKDVLAGLDAAHRQTIVHRDVKPHNVLLDGAGRALIADFGLSLHDGVPDVLQSIQQSVSLDQAQGRDLAGTLAYMAPEVREGQPATPAADVFAVGVLLFEMLVGRRPMGVELPGRRRKGLSKGTDWDRLYSEACGPLGERFADAGAMLASVAAMAAPPAADSLVRESFLAPTPAGIPSREPQPQEGIPAKRGDEKGFSSQQAEGFSFQRKTSPPLTLDLGGGVEMELILIPAGEFLMGSPEEGRLSSEGPQCRIKISDPFYLGKYQVTQKQWRAVMGNNPSYFKKEPAAFSEKLKHALVGTNFSTFDNEDHPVENVSWEDCQKFCRKLSQKTGCMVRLPTEAEWEYACRAGTTERYSFGSVNAVLNEYAWFNGNSGSKTHPVGQKKPNSWGLHDMHGNVWEWCQDWYADKYSNADQVDPIGPGNGHHRVLRGGSWIQHSAGLPRRRSHQEHARRPRHQCWVSCRGRDSLTLCSLSLLPFAVVIFVGIPRIPSTSRERKRVSGGRKPPVLPPGSLACARGS